MFSGPPSRKRRPPTATVATRPDTPGSSSAPGLSQRPVIIEATKTYTLTSRSALPTAVKEALLAVDDLSVCVAGINEGYSWVIIGSDVFVWNLLDASTLKTLHIPNHAYSGDLKHATIYIGPTSVGFLAISTAGDVTFWGDISTNTAPVQTNLSLDRGQETTKLISCGDGHFVVGTTTGTLYLLSVTSSGVTSFIHSRVIQRTTGMFSGLSRMFRWGRSGSQTPSTATDSTQRIVSLCAAPTPDAEGVATFYALTEATLHRWQVAVSPAVAKQASELGLAEHVREHIRGAVGEGGAAVAVRQLDVQCVGEAVYVLCGFHVGRLLGFCVAEATSDGRLAAVHMCQPREAGGEVGGLDSRLFTSARLAVRPTVPASLCVMWPELLLVATAAAGDSWTLVERRVADERFLGPPGSVPSDPAAFYLLSPANGVVSLAMAGVELAMPPREPAKAVVAADSESQRNLLMAAFSQYLVQPAAVAGSLVAALPDLPRAVESVSTLILNAQPTGDPRWAGEQQQQQHYHPQGAGLIRQQLEEKRQKHRQFLQFLGEHGLWGRLGDATCCRLLEHGEKLEAAIALRDLHNEGGELAELLHAAMKAGLAAHNITEEQWRGLGVGAQDIFYNRVTRIDMLFGPLGRLTAARLAELVHGDPARPAALVCAVNRVFVAVLWTALEYRRLPSTRAVYHIADNPTGAPLPWNAAAELRDHLKDQLQRTVDSVQRLAASDGVAGELLHQLYLLGDVLLQGYTDDRKMSKRLRPDWPLRTEFEQWRRIVEVPLVRAQPAEFVRMGLTLAETYRDFELLLEWCEQTGAYDELERYDERFSRKGFTECAFQWYLANCKYSRLLSLPLFTERHGAELGRFLEANSERHAYTWVHQLRSGAVGAAGQRLHEQALCEHRYHRRQMTLLALAKLALLADHEDHDQRLRAVDQALELRKLQDVFLQSATPLISLAELDGRAARRFDRIPPLPPAALVESLLADPLTYERVVAALEAVEHASLLCPDAELHTLLNAVWLRALVANDWYKLAKRRLVHAIGDTELSRELQHTVFFSLAKLKKDLLPINVFQEVASCYVRLTEQSAELNSVVEQLLYLAYSLAQSEFAPATPMLTQ